MWNARASIITALECEFHKGFDRNLLKKFHAFLKIEWINTSAQRSRGKIPTISYHYRFSANQTHQMYDSVKWIGACSMKCFVVAVFFPLVREWFGVWFVKKSYLFLVIAHKFVWFSCYYYQYSYSELRYLDKIDVIGIFAFLFSARTVEIALCMYRQTHAPSTTRKSY